MRLFIFASILGATGGLAAIELRSVNYHAGSSSFHAPASRVVPSSSDGLQFSVGSAMPSSSDLPCQQSCSNYNDILVNCQSDAGQENVYDSCVCNDDNFQSYVQECIGCMGTNSAPYEFQQKCKSVAPDCTVACSQFGLIVESCGDPHSSDYESCMCGSAYDVVYTTTFNQAFMDCVNCENGGGAAAYWEATCCAKGHGCVGISPQASREAKTIPAATSSPAPSASTKTFNGSAPAEMDVNAIGIGLIPLLLGVGVGLL